MLDMDNQVDELQEIEDSRALEESDATVKEEGQTTPDTEAMDASFMSESIYQKLPTPTKKRPNKHSRKSRLLRQSTQMLSLG